MKLCFSELSLISSDVNVLLCCCKLLYGQGRGDMEREIKGKADVITQEDGRRLRTRM